MHDGKPSGKDWSHVYREVDIKDFHGFLRSVLTSVLPACAEALPIYIWHAHVQQHIIWKVFEELDLLFHQVIVWVKPVATFGRSFYRWRHEPCAFGWRRGKQPKHGAFQLDSVWDIDHDGKKMVVGNEHPTQKALRLFEIPMELHTKPGAIVLEPFSGSGSQLVAAERLARKCRAMEISPAFVDVAVHRWERATGQSAILDGEGRTFAEVSEEREGAEE